MLQVNMELFSEEITLINSHVGFLKRDNKIHYFNGQMPLFQHSIDDKGSFKMYLSQLYVTGVAKQVEIIRACGVDARSLKRWVKKYRKEGACSFFFNKKRHRKSTKLTPSKLLEIQSLLDSHLSLSEISQKTGIKEDTIRKGINRQKLHRPAKGQSLPSTNDRGSIKSERTQDDAEKTMGRGCSRESERVLASKGKLEFATSTFETCKDIPNGGVVLALPVLIVNGLFSNLNLYDFPSGFYHIRHILLTLAFMSLLRLKSPENIRDLSPGEFGKLLGLDRCPEVKTLRTKLEILSSQNQGREWARNLSNDWMLDNPETAGVLYVDGHVRPYYGKMTKLPRRFVSRQKLCLRGTTDYWVNDYSGLPFFVINKTINAGLIKTLKEDIIPRLLEDVPNQPSKKELLDSPYLYRFLLVCDREIYSPDFFTYLWEKRIACCTYNKYVKDEWSLLEFYPTLVHLSNGNVEEMFIAERGTLIGNKIWMREIRKLTESGHQTSIITTDFIQQTDVLAAQMFGRWCQENYFKYMMEHFGIDRLVEHKTESIPDTKLLVNPEYRKANKKIKSLNGKINTRKLKCLKLNLTTELTKKEQQKIEQKRAKITENLELLEKELEETKEIQSNLKHYITFAELPESEKFDTLKEEKKRITDIIKMISYRAETALSSMAKEYMLKKGEVRTFIRRIFKTEIDLFPDYENKKLEIRFHNMTDTNSDKIASKICKELNKSETIFPGTDLMMIFKVGTR